VVLGIAVLIVVVGLIGAAISSGSGSGPVAAPRLALHRVTLTDGTTVGLVPAATALHPLESEGQPPPDIVGHLAVPAGSRRTGTVNDDLAAGQFDRSADFTTAQAGDDVVATFAAALPKLGWTEIYRGPGTRNGKSGTEVLAKRGGSDGYEWEVGVVVRPTTGADTTLFTVEVFELSGVT
jgi:hypothetical protein